MAASALGPVYCFCKDTESTKHTKQYKDGRAPFVYFKCETNACDFMMGYGDIRPTPTPDAIQCRRCKAWVSSKLARKGANAGKFFYACECNLFQWAKEGAEITQQDENA